MIDEKTFRLDGRIALVTGSSEGIGLALARGLGQAGATVVLNGRTQSKLDQAAEALKGEGLAVHQSRFDVTDSDAVKAAVARIEAEIGAIEILVNNAGIQRRAPIQDFPESDWHELMRTNLDSVFFVGKAVAQKMIERKRGKIITFARYKASSGGLASRPTPRARAR